MTGLAGGGVQLGVQDDGQGFVEIVASTDVPAQPAKAADRDAGGFGIMGILERASLIGASVDIQSLPGWGTRVAVLYPGTG